jgi:hypothetical protein
MWRKRSAWLSLSGNTLTWRCVSVLDLRPGFEADSDGGQAGGSEDGIGGLSFTQSDRQSTAKKGVKK